MTKHNDKQIQVQMVSLILVHALDDYMENNNDQRYAEKMTVVMSAMTRIMAMMAASLDMPQEIVLEAIKADMESAHKSMSQDETKH